ncbi:MAG: hypothetical protein IJK52_13585 [Oscillospiraceae bacterium]|nr:hypothetical protein [Oscillospiraceae bacterium]
MQEKESQKTQLESTLLQFINRVLENPHEHKDSVQFVPAMIDALIKLWETP